MTAAWANEAIEMSDGDLAELTPLLSHELVSSDVVLVHISGKRYSHVVLHMVISVEEDNFLIGSHQGRIDGWVRRRDIYGVAVSHGINSVAE